MKATKQPIPSIHSNGTSAEALLEQLEDASNALDNALEALSQAAPHGRDYYPQGAGAYHIAREDHMTRTKRVQQTRDEIHEIRLAVYEQDEENRAARQARHR